MSTTRRWRRRRRCRRWRHQRRRRRPSTLRLLRLPVVLNAGRVAAEELLRLPDGPLHVGRGFDDVT